MNISDKNPDNLFPASNKNEAEDFWDKLSASEKEEIISAMNELDNGLSFSFSEIIDKHKKK